MMAMRVNDLSGVLVLHVYVLSAIVSLPASVNIVLHMPSSMADLT